MQYIYLYIYIYVKYISHCVMHVCCVHWGKHSEVGGGF